MSPAFRIVYHPEVVRRDIRRLDPAVKERVRRAIEVKLREAPEGFAKPLAYSRKGLWRLRVGDWRVVFALREDEVWILRIAHRSEVYDMNDRGMEA